MYEKYRPRHFEKPEQGDAKSKLLKIELTQKLKALYKQKYGQSKKGGVLTRDEVVESLELNGQTELVSIIQRCFFTNSLNEVLEAIQLPHKPNRMGLK